MAQKSSDKIKYLKQLCIAAVCVFVIMELFVRAFPMPSFISQSDILLKHKRSKIKDFKDGVIVFVGDSSLGNGVDEKALSAYLKVPVANMATTGSWGTYADYFIVKEIIDSGVRPGGVCIFHTSDQWNRDDVDMPILLARKFNKMSFKIAAFNVFEHLSMLRQSDIYNRFFMKFTDFYDIWAALQKEVAFNKALPMEIKKNDYVKQSERVDWEQRELRFNSPVFYVNEKINRYLTKTIKLCQQNNIPVYLASGPSWDKKAESMAPYNRRLVHWMKKKCQTFDNCRMLYEVVPSYPGQLIGDSDDHLTYEGREIFTRWIAQFLK